MDDHGPHQPRSRGWRARLALAIALPILVTGLGLAQAGPVRGDALDDALAEQKALAAQLAKQQQALDALIAQQGSLSSEIAATTASLAKNTASLANITTQIQKIDRKSTRLNSSH